MSNLNGHKRAVIYTRVSTDEQAEHGYSLQSQSEACAKYAVEHGFSVLAQITDDYSGAKLNRPGLDQLRGLTDRREAEAVIVYTADRLTRNLAHSLVLREEWQRAGIELHYCNRGKSEDTPESRMTENIEAVFSDYWRAKIVESSARGRRTKAANGKWPCDGHAAYGYRKEGKAREARLVIDEAETAIVQRIYALYIGADGQPMNLQTIAAILTAEKVLPPNRGAAVKHPGKGWYRGTVRNILTRRSYIGEFHYGGHSLDLPDLAILDAATFEAAQRRRMKSRAVANYRRKYEYLLVGHVRCSCGMGMSGNPLRGGKNLYYDCNSDTTKRHMRECRELRVRADLADPVVWEWLTGLLCDEAKLEKGLRECAERRETELQPKRERMALVEDLITGAERKVRRLATAFAEEGNETVGAALRAELKDAGREREALVAERNTLRADLAQGMMTEADRRAVKTMAADIRRKLAEPTFQQKRALVNMLDVRVQLAWKDDRRWLKATCGLALAQTPSETPGETSNGTWLTLPAVGGKSLSTMTT